jgi:hypothetical protein
MIGYTSLQLIKSTQCIWMALINDNIVEINLLLTNNNYINVDSG